MTSRIGCSGGRIFAGSISRHAIRCSAPVNSTLRWAALRGNHHARPAPLGLWVHRSPESAGVSERSTQPRRQHPSRTTTVPQKPFLLNSPFVLHQAAQLLGRPELPADSVPEKRIDCLHWLLYGRAAEKEEIRQGLQYIDANGNNARAWEDYAQVLMLANEFAFID